MCKLKFFLNIVIVRWFVSLLATLYKGNAMNRYIVLLLILISLCIAGCGKKRVKMNLVESNTISFQSIPFEIHVAYQLAYMNGGKQAAKTGVDKVTWGGGVQHTWRSYDGSTYVNINHLHKDPKMVWLTTANGEGRKLLFVDGIKFWHKKEKITLQNGESYWEELWLYHTGSDRIYIQVLSRFENKGFEPVEFKALTAA